MQFPYFQFPLFGDGLIIAFDAILHVFISHGVAIGMVTMIFLAELFGYFRHSEDWENFAYAALKPVVIIITGVGAVTGVGIWFITSGLVPAAIGSMLRIFFWPWFIEWIVFALEVIVILIYYFQWHTWQGPKKKYHLLLGLFYILLACMSAFLITGILGFMLTPDGWPWNRGFWTAFFNPTFLPQLAWRIDISLSMGALFIIFYLLGSRKITRIFRKLAMNFYAKVLAIPLVLMPFCAWWWYAMVPDEAKSHAKQSLLLWLIIKQTGLFGIFDEVFWISLFINIIIVFSIIIFAWREWVWWTRLIIVPVLLIVLFFVAEYERVREFIRGPYLMPGYMYANTVLIKEQEYFQKEGMLPHAYWFHRIAPHPSLEQKGAYLFAQTCGTCHTIGGRNNIADRFRGRSEDGIYVILGRTEDMVPWMPAFGGTDEERRVTAKFLKNVVDQKYHFFEPARYPPMKDSGP